MKLMKKALALIIICFTLFHPRWGYAEPSMPVIVANHELKECATMFTGDDCMTCRPPEGWESTSKNGGWKEMP